MIRYRREIDGLRAIAIVPVILFHAGFGTFSGGYVGVDVFFVISGYLITGILLRDLEQHSFSIVRFYERRVRRILPALFTVVLACLPFAWFCLSPKYLASFSQSLVALTAFASNIFFWRRSGYFEPMTELNPLVHTWSLAVEEQYYVLFPLFLLLAWRFGRRWIAGIICAVAVISLSLSQYYSSVDSSFNFYILPTRAWELMIGALLSLYHANERDGVRPVIGQWLSALGLGLIVFAVFAYDGKTPFPSVYALVPTLGAALIILFATPANLVGKLLGSAPFRGIGLISYSAYLWHQPLFAFARHVAIDRPSPLVMGVLAVVSLLLAYLTWRYVERPFRDRNFISRRRIFALAIVGSMLLAGAGVLGNAYSYKRSGDAAFSDGNIDRDAESCVAPFFGKGRVDKCATNSPRPSILLIGDSHAGHYYKGLLADLPGAAVIWNGDCYAGAAYSNICSRKTEAVKRYVAANRGRIKLVLLSAAMNLYLDPTNLGGHDNPEHAADDGRDRVYRDLGSFVAFLRDNGIEVGLLYDIPELRHRTSYLRCQSEPGYCQQLTSRETVLASQAAQRRLYGRLEAAFGLNHFDPLNIFCDAHYCRSSLNGSLLYWDDNHVNARGSALVSMPLVEWITQTFPETISSLARRSPPQNR